MLLGMFQKSSTKKDGRNKKRCILVTNAYVECDVFDDPASMCWYSQVVDCYEMQAKRKGIKLKRY